MPKLWGSNTPTDASSKVGKAKLVSVVGAGCAAVLLSCVPQFEGMVLRGYTDPIGIVTACAGHTATAVLGKPYTKAECEKLLVDDLVKHAEGVKRCIERPLPVHQLAAAVSFAFNVGVPRFCGSTFAKKLRANDPMACAEISRWTFAGGRELPGLVKRRAVERDMCDGKI